MQREPVPHHKFCAEPAPERGIQRKEDLAGQDIGREAVPHKAAGRREAAQQHQGHAGRPAHIGILRADAAGH